MIPGRHLAFLNGSPECLWSGISQNILMTKVRKWGLYHYAVVIVSVRNLQLHWSGLHGMCSNHNTVHVDNNSIALIRLLIVIHMLVVSTHYTIKAFVILNVYRHGSCYHYYNYERKKRSCQLVSGADLMLLFSKQVS